MDKYSQLKDLLDTSCKRDELLSKHTTLQIGGPAKLFLAVNNEEKTIPLMLKPLEDSVDLVVAIIDNCVDRSEWLLALAVSPVTRSVVL